jgi:hypothetical protein
MKSGFDRIDAQFRAKRIVLECSTDGCRTPTDNSQIRDLSPPTRLCDTCYEQALLNQQWIV